MNLPPLSLSPLTCAYDLSPKNPKESIFIKDPRTIKSCDLGAKIQGGLPAGIHGLFSGWYCGLASKKVTLGVSMPAANGGNHFEDVEVRKSGYFDVIVGMNWFSKRKFLIVCHEKVVRIPLEGEEILRVHSEHTQRVVKTLMNTKVDLVHGATLVAKPPSRLAPSEMQELSEQLQQLEDKGFI
ncbi:hypothetical protein Tco_0654078 [Tanacetum coccineum]|uniref:Uncharacterized protein n=1 Tax=Tanacetum coccineum TaxID=301880 RepID=A0ABQ4X273_9ASTR